MIDLLLTAAALPWGAFAAAAAAILLGWLLGKASSLLWLALPACLTICGTLLGLLQGWTLEQILTPVLAVTAVSLLGLAPREGGGGIGL